MKKIAAITVVTVIAAGVVATTSHSAADGYPLDTCIVSGEPLDAMGGPYEFEYQGRPIKFCCEDCKPDFLKQPEKYLARLEQARTAKPSGTDENGNDSADAHHGDDHDGQPHHHSRRQ